MTQREILQFGDPILRTVCDEITEIDEGVRELVADLLENVNEEGRAGLAANQIGVNLRAFSWNIEGDIGYILNPKITYLSDEKELMTEGCLSVEGFSYENLRSVEAKCEGIDLDGKKKVLKGRDIWAKLIQHEIGHLDGHLYIDFLTGDQKAKMLQDLGLA